MKTVHYEKDLQELNYGIVQKDLRNDSDMRLRFQNLLNGDRQKLVKYIATGKQPMFGYPQVCYDNSDERQTRERLVDHVLANRTSGMSIPDILGSIEKYNHQ